MAALVGYNGSASLVELLAYVACLGTAFGYYFGRVGQWLPQTSTRPKQAA